MLELTVLGVSGSYGAPAGGACSGYLVRTREATIWMDCGNGTFTNLAQHCDPAELTAVVISHAHPDHCVDLYGLHVFDKYGLERTGRPVYAAPRVAELMEPLVERWDDCFEWTEIDDGDEASIGDAQLRFSRTDHPIPTTAVEIGSGGKRLVYTADTGPDWGPDAFDPADLLLSEATYTHDDRRSPVHISARQAGEKAVEARARNLMITHLWPTVDPAASVAEASEAYGREVTLAAPHMTVMV